MKSNGVIGKLMPVLNLYNSEGGATSDLTNATVRLLLNLSFDSDLRTGVNILSNHA